MDATELSRWTRFAAKGGIGKCTATHDCVAESPEDLMFLKDDAIIVLMQLPEDTRDGEGTSGGVGSGENGWYLGYCEGVVGRFQGKHVHFHSKLKRPVMTKRSSTASARSPSRRNSNAHGGPGGSRATTPIQTASPRMSMSTSTSTPPSTSASTTPDSTPRLPAKVARSIIANTRSPSLGSSRSPTPGTNTAVSNGAARSSPSSVASSSRHGHSYALGLGFGSSSSGSISTLGNWTPASTSVVHSSPRSSPLVGPGLKLLPTELDDVLKPTQLSEDVSAEPPIASETTSNSGHHPMSEADAVRSPPAEFPNPFDPPGVSSTAETAVSHEFAPPSSQSSGVQTIEYKPASADSRPSPTVTTDSVAPQQPEASSEVQPEDRSEGQEPSIAEGRAKEDGEDELYDAPSSSRISRISLAMSDGEVGIGLSLLQDLASGEGDFGDGDFSSDDEENTGEWRLNPTEPGGEGVQRSASVSSRSTGLGYHDDEGIGGKMVDGRESERDSYVSEQSRYSVDTMSKELDNLESTIARLRPKSSIDTDFVMLTPTVGSMVIPPRISSTSSSTVPSSSSPPPTSPHLPATLPLNLTPRRDTFSVNGTASNGISSGTAPIPSPTSPTFSIRTHASTSTTRTTSTTHTARTTRTGYSIGSGGSDDWDGAGDIYDDYMYRYSTRLSVVSGRIAGGNGRRGSGGSGASLAVGRDTPPVPQTRGSADDVDERFGGKGSAKGRPGALDIQLSNRLRPSGSAVPDSESKVLDHLDAPGSSKSTSSPLLHTTWGDALSSPEEGVDGLSAIRGNPGSTASDSFFDGRPGAAGFLRSPTLDGPASAIRQRLEMNWGPNGHDADVAGAGRNVQINHTSSSMGSASSAVQEQDDVPTYGVPGGIVVEDDERAPDVSLTTAKMGIGDNSFVSADFEGADEREESPEPAGKGGLRNDWKEGVDDIASPGLPLVNPHDSVDDTLEEITRTTSPVPLDSSLANSTSSDAILLSATAEVAPPPPPQPPAAQLLAPPVSHLRPSLAELRGEKDPNSGMRSSLFMPHPNAPKPTVLSQGPMYIRDPNSHVPPSVAALPYGSQRPSEPGHLPAAANSRYPPTTATPPPRHPGSGLGGLSRALHMAMTSRGTLGRGPTLFARCDVDLASSIGPVAITFSPEPFVGPPPGPANIAAANGPDLMPPASAPGGGVLGSMTPVRTLSGGSAGPQPDTSSPKLPRVVLPTANANEVQGSAAAAAPETAGGAGTPNSGVIPRPNFYPKASSARPRSRSFSEFGSTSIEVPMPIASDDNTPLKIPSMRTMARSMTASRASQGSTTVSPKPPALKLQSSLRSPYAPSPLSIPSSGLSARGAPKSPTSPLSQSSTSFAPPSPTTSSRRHQLRQVTSNPSLAAPPSPRIVVPPSLSRKRSSGASPTSPTQQSTSDRGSTSTPPRQNSIPDVSSSAASRASVDGENPRGMVASPTPMVTRQLSLRSKLSLPNLRRKQSRQDDASSIAASSIDNEYETAQAEGMDFELVRPSFSHLHSARTSEDSSFIKDGGSIDLGKPEMSIGGLLRTGSPAMSFSSGQRSPSVADVKTPKVSDSESSSMEGHRQRELRWIALMSSVPASQARKNKKVKKLLVEGVPSSVRYLVWIHLTDGKARNVPKVYEQLVKRGHVPSYKDIERDVQAYIRESAQPATMRESMMSLLQAYLTMVPDVQYSRGLTLIVGNILLLAPEEDGFWTFVSLMDSYLRPYFSSSSSQMEVDAMLFSRALEANDPQVAKKVLTTMSINPTAICFPWFTSLFVNTLPSSYIQRVWDLFLFEGIPFLVRVGLALISTCRRQILEATSAEAVLQLLHHPPSSLLLSTPDAFLSLLNSFKLKDDDFRKQRIKMEAQVKRQTQAPRAPATSSISLPK
ncbi:hypothetical protein EYR36_011434 [Pleurotus pulmonarius]|nr:hypothetical protein EYR36_011434 [Pleurotus pulmonarius]